MGLNKGGVRKTSHFIALNVNILKTARDTLLRVILMTNRKWHIRFRLTTRSVTSDDLDLL